MPRQARQKSESGIYQETQNRPLSLPCLYAHNAGLAITSAFTGAQACSLGICFDMSLQVVEEAMA